MEVVQRQNINNIDVYLDKDYPIWDQSGQSWHLTMKDPKRWHITTEDRGASYWFEIDGGKVTSVKPKKKEYGSHKEKHHSLDDAPSEVSQFVKTYIMDIIKVTDPKP